MSWRSRFLLFMNVKSSAALDQLEDPREVLDYAHGRQQEMLRLVKLGLIEVATSRRQLERQLDRLRARVAHHEDQARRALRVDREDLARSALDRKQAVLREIQALESQMADAVADEDRLRQADEQLTARAEAFRLHRHVVSARYSAAEAQVRVSEAIAGIAPDDMVELSLAVDRAEDKVERFQARALAVDALLLPETLASSAGRDAIDRELNAINGTEAVERELAALKAELAQDQSPESDTSGPNPEQRGAES